MRLFLSAHQLAQSLSKRPEFFTVVSRYIPHYQTFFLKRPNRISGQGFLSLAYLARLDCFDAPFLAGEGVVEQGETKGLRFLHNILRHGHDDFMLPF